MNRRRSARRDDRGAVAVEAALVTPILLLLVFGIVEVSLLMRDTVATTSAVRVGARIASAAANAGPGTCPVVVPPETSTCTPARAPGFAQAAADAIASAGSAMPKDSIDWILIYRANTEGYPQPEGNTALACTTDCVKYVWKDSANQFQYSSGAWDSTLVNACVNDPSRTTLGISMEARHPFITGLFGDGLSINERSVMDFEPLPNDECQPGAHA